jgi:hypothetical protein
VRVARGPENFEKTEFFRCLESLLAQLHGVDAGPQDPVKKSWQVALPDPRVRAQVQPRPG